VDLVGLVAVEVTLDGHAYFDLVAAAFIEQDISQLLVAVIISVLEQQQNQPHHIAEQHHRVPVTPLLLLHAHNEVHDVAYLL